jgi:hypothetical protein
MTTWTTVGMHDINGSYQQIVSSVVDIMILVLVNMASEDSIPSAYEGTNTSVCIDDKAAICLLGSGKALSHTLSDVTSWLYDETTSEGYHEIYANLVLSMIGAFFEMNYEPSAAFHVSYYSHPVI